MSAPPEKPAKPLPGRRRYGFVEWFRHGDRERVDDALAGLGAAGASYLRTQLSWAEFHLDDGPDWYDWLIPRLAGAIELVPCIHYTPPSLSRTGRSSGAPRRLKDYADFLDLVLTRYGQHFSSVELWNEPNNVLDWDWRDDHDYYLFAEMIGNAAHWARGRGWRPVLGGPCPFEAHWFELMGERGLLAEVAAVGLHGFPGTWDSPMSGWAGWSDPIGQLRAILDRYNPTAEIWITETGYSTWAHDEVRQVERFLEALEAPADRVFWYGWRDLPEDVPAQEGPWFDARHYFMGAVESSGREKLLARLLREGGEANLASVVELARPAVVTGPRRPVAITGGSGFIGCNLAAKLLEDGEEVLIVDNLSRPGVEENLEWLVARHGARVHPAIVDVREQRALRPALKDAAAVFHFAAQTAVTTSLIDPRHDFEVNAQGTLNVLEAARATGRPVPVIMASTNKVYGGLADIAVGENDGRYQPADETLRARGISEDRPIDFSTPYGCSKGAADQYVLDYAKSFGVPSAVLRMSCIYGPHQFGTEDQGWVAHFLIRALTGKPITIYGDGMQVRDVLEVSDAVNAYRQVLARIDRLSGHAFNLGGGPQNAISLNRLLTEIGRLLGRPPAVSYGPWRPGDQPWFVADTSRLSAATGWRARIGWRDGVAGLGHWLASRHGAAEEIEKRRIPA